MSLDKFSTIEMSNELRKSIEEIGFENATTIQSEAIPLIKAGEDVIGLSQTGSGKTAAFGLPAIDSIDLDIDPRTPQVLIVCPTRELALQSSDQLKKFAKYKRKINIVTIYGGDSNKQTNNNYAEWMSDRCWYTWSNNGSHAQTYIASGKCKNGGIG